MNIPNELPWLSSGKHDNLQAGACVMEYVSMLAGEQFTDRPRCTDELVTHAAWALNDNLPDDDRQRVMAHLVPRLLEAYPIFHERQIPEIVRHAYATRANFLSTGLYRRYQRLNAVNGAFIGYKKKKLARDFPILGEADLPEFVITHFLNLIGVLEAHDEMKPQIAKWRALPADDEELHSKPKEQVDA